MLDGLAPLKYSLMQIEKGDYDNSGILLKTHLDVEKVLFSLDLTSETVKRAKKLKCDTVVTHHPAIYYPIKTLDAFGETAAFALAAENRLNVISMHLNLDIADGGIDDCLCSGLGGVNPETLNSLDEYSHYGREFKTDITLAGFKKRIEKNFGTKRITVYGDINAPAGTVASFCGAGSGYALDYARKGGVANTVVTADIPHHVLLELTERGKQVVVLTHYASENYGFFRFYERVKNKVCDKAETFYFEDKRFL